MKRSKGFTLVEVLIVVVIIAILASLVMPRMLAQTKRAITAEAFQVVGAIKRNAERIFDLTGSYPSGPDGYIQIYSDGSGGYGGSSGDWGSIGMKGPEKSKNWSYYFYSYPEWFMVEAYRYVSDDEYGYMDYDSSPAWYCDETFFTNGGDPSKPCTLA